MLGPFILSPRVETKDDPTPINRSAPQDDRMRIPNASDRWLIAAFIKGNHGERSTSENQPR